MVEEISEEEINYELLSKITLDDMFSKTIIYPNQFDHPLIKENDFLFFEENPNLDEVNFKKKRNMENYRIIDNSKITVKSNLKLKKVKIVNFFKTNKIYDICITTDNLILACGENLAKIFVYDNSSTDNSFTSNNDNVLLTILDKEDNFYSICYSKPFSENTFFVAIAGEKGIIRVIGCTQFIDELDSSYFYEFKHYEDLIGHRNEVYDLKFHPFYSQVLLSCSKDFSIRLWNVYERNQLGIFAGPEGHVAEVLTIDWHLTGDCFVSSGIDSSVKIWEINNRLKENLILSVNSNSSESNNRLSKPKTLILQTCIFSCNEVHENYIDCVKFNGNFILSKSVDGVIKEWLPQFNKEGDYYCLINTYIFTLEEKIWFMRFALSESSEYISIGNTTGSIFVFKLNDVINPESSSIGEDFNYSYNIKEIQTYNTTVKSLIRQVSFHPEMSFLAYCNDDGDIFINDINK